MSQMYRVRYTKNGEGMVETGEAIVCAPNQDNALSIVAQINKLPTSGTQFEVSRVKPPYVLIKRAEVERRMGAYEATTVSEGLACVATFPHKADLPEREDYSVVVRAEIRAEGETDAIQGVARSLVRHAMGERQKPSLKSLELSCDAIKREPIVSRYDENAGYTRHSFVRGGAVRPR
jgi:hypothetical protein